MTVDSDSIQSIPPLTIVGAGKLGMAVAEAWQRHGGALGECVTKGQPWSPKGLVFEATSPEAAFDNVKRCIDAGVPVVTGSTGWLERAPEIEALAVAQGCAAFCSTNFSPGVHALNLIAEHASQVFQKMPGYNASISEVHHIHKKDAPSGTALTLAEHVKNGGWPDKVTIESERRGEVVGLHSLRWDSDHDVVALHHEAKSRVGFAEGAVWALKWTWKQHESKRFGLFTMNNLFDS